MNYTGDTDPLNLAGLGNIDTGNNTNVDFGGSSAKVYYWRASSVDGSFTGNWNSPYYWSLDVNATIGQNDPFGCIPTALDTVIFDNLSGNGGAMTVTIDDAQFANTVLWEEGSTPPDMNWEITPSGVLGLSGQLTLSSNITATWDDDATINLNGTDTTWIETNGVAIDGNIYIDDGVKMMSSEVFGSASIILRTGEFNANGFDLNLGYIRSDNNASRTLNLDNITLTLSERERIQLGGFDLYYAWYLDNITNLNYSGTNTIINITTPFNVAFMGQGLTYYGVSFESQAVIGGKNTFADSLTLKANASFYEGNTINKLSLKAQAVNTTYTFPATDTTFFT